MFIFHFDSLHELPCEVLAILSVQELIFGEYRSNQLSGLSDGCLRPEHLLLLVLAHQGAPTAYLGIDAPRFCGYLLVGKHALQRQTEQSLLLCLQPLEFQSSFRHHLVDWRPLRRLQRLPDKGSQDRWLQEHLRDERAQ